MANFVKPGKFGFLERIWNRFL